MNANKGRQASAMTVACAFGLFASGCPDPERTQERSREFTETLNRASTPIPQTLAQQALSRCEAFGDALAESTAELDTVYVEYGNARDSIRERVEQQTRLSDLEGELESAEARNEEAYSDYQSALAEFEGEQGGERDAEARLLYAQRSVRNREATITTLEEMIAKTDPGTVPRLQLESRLAEAKTLLVSAQSEVLDVESFLAAARPPGSDGYQETCCIISRYSFTAGVDVSS